jgi:hypothetical protein
MPQAHNRLGSHTLRMGIYLITCRGSQHSVLVS